MSKQNDREHLVDMMERGIITAAEANVQAVRNDRFRVVHRLSRDARNALNAAVKRGELEHLKKDGMKPEVYYHPSFQYLAIEARNKAVNAGVNALKSVCC